MKRILSTTALVAAALTIPAVAQAQSYNSAHQQCKKSEDRKQIFGGVLGAVAGGVLGSQVSGNGARTEGSAIGAVVGGLAGAGIADKMIDCDPVYPHSSQSTYGQSSTYSNNGYGASQTPVHYEETVYGGSSSPYYEDRVTVSNHPVYSDPSYGAGAISQGTTYNTGTVSYPPTTSYSAPTYSSPVYTTTSTVPASYQGYTTSGYSQTSYSPSYSNGYSQSYPQSHSAYQPKRVTYGRRHLHGKYECHAAH